MSGSSRKLKKEITHISAAEAREAVACLTPVSFRYKADESHDVHIGFIAEDVPELVASPGRDAVSAMDVVAVLTKVDQEPERTIHGLEVRLAALEAKTKREVESR